MGDRSRIKGITIEIGGDTTGLSKALTGVNKKINDTQSELKDVDRLLKLDPKNTELLRQKQEMLAKSIGATEDKLASLKEANNKVTDSVKNYDAWKEAYDPIQNEITETKKKLSDLKETQKEVADIHGVDSSEYKEMQKSISDTAQKLKNLKKEAEDVSEQFGHPISESQYDALQREIIATESDLKGLKEQSERTENAIKNIDDRTIEDVADAADKAREELKNAGDEASNFGDYLKAGAIIEGAKGIVSALKDVSEETKEYSKIMGALDVSSQAAGYSAQETEATYKQLYAVLADDQTAATTTANLQALGLSQENLTKMTNAAIGAWATYGDSIPIDGLAEAINETSKTGTVTGTLADVLNWASLEGETFGVTLKENTEANEEWNNAVMDAQTAEDYFNLALQDTTSNAERANIIMQMLADQGLMDAGEQWRENNEALAENNEANAEMQKQLSDLGTTVMPVITDVLEIVGKLLEKFNGLDESTQMIILGVIALIAALGPAMSIFGGVSTSISGMTSLFGNLTGTVLPAVGNTFSSVCSFIAANPIAILIAAIVALVVLIATKGDEIQEVLQKVDDFLQNVFATNWEDIFGPVLGGYLNVFFANLKNIWDSVCQIFNGVIDFIRGVFTGDWERAWTGVKEIFGGIFNGLVALAKAPLNGIIGLLNMAINAINSLIKGFNGIGFTMPKWLGGGSWHPNIPTIGKIPFLANGGILSEGSAIVGEAEPELLTMMGNQAKVTPLTRQNRTASFGDTNIYVYGAPGQDVRQLAELVSEELFNEYARREAAVK